MADRIPPGRRICSKMQRFHIKKDVDTRGQEWSPQTTVICPYCFVENLFYCQLRDNKCKNCGQQMPFPSAMAKEQDKRVAYHLGEFGNV